MAPNLSGGANGEWKTKCSGQQRTEMVVSYVEEHASDYRRLLKPDVAAVAKGSGKEGGVKEQISRRTVEYCADEDSNIRHMTDPSQCEVIRLTERHDVCSFASREPATRALKTINQTLLWGSMPCTCGSVRSPQNLAKGRSAADAVLAHREQFESIWYNFKKVALLMHARGGKSPLSGLEVAYIGNG